MRQNPNLHTVAKTQDASATHKRVADSQGDVDLRPLSLQALAGISGLIRGCGPAMTLALIHDAATMSVASNQV